MSRFFAFIACLTLSSTVSASSPNLSEALNKIPCSSKVFLKLNSKLKKQTWAPVSISKRAQPFVAGIEFRDTRSMKAYKIYEMSKKSYFVETDLKTLAELEHSWDPFKACAVTKSKSVAKLAPLPVNEGFTDADLLRLLKSQKQGLIYVWTPTMPLSVEGIEFAKKAAKERKLHLTVLMDAEAEKDHVKTVQEQGRVIASEVTRVASHELYARQVSRHYPVVYMYKDGFLSNRNFPGQKETDVLVAHIDREFAQLKKDLQ